MGPNLCWNENVGKGNLITSPALQRSDIQMIMD